MKSANGPLRVGIGGPVGSGKTTLTEKLCKAMRDDYSIAVVTNDIYTREDAEALVRLQALSSDRIMGVETGGCPHTAIREDASINLAGDRRAQRAASRDLDVIFIESGGDNLAATFSPDLADLSIYVISVCQGGDIPRKGGPAITRSDLLVINKSDLAPHVGVDLDEMNADAGKARGDAALRVHGPAPWRGHAGDHRFPESRGRALAAGRHVDRPPQHEAADPLHFGNFALRRVERIELLFGAQAEEPAGQSAGLQLREIGKSLDGLERASAAGVV